MDINTIIEVSYSAIIALLLLLKEVKHMWFAVLVYCEYEIQKNLNICTSCQFTNDMNYVFTESENEWQGRVLAQAIFMFEW